MNILVTPTRWQWALLGIITFALGNPALETTAADAPDLREEAYANLWNEHADRAVKLFRRWQKEHPDQMDTDTRRGLALALSWDGRQEEAREIYAQLVGTDSLDGEARIGLARAWIWDNQLAKGWRTLGSTETDLQLTPQSRNEAGDFALKVLNEYTPTSATTWRGSWDSDHLHIHRFSTLYATTFANGILVQTGPRVSLFSQATRPDVTALRWQCLVTAGLAQDLSFHGLGWLEHFRSRDPLPGNTDNLDWMRPGADAWITWQATSRLRFDAGGASQPVDTYLGFARRIGYEQESLSCDWRLTRKFAVGASGIRATYSDNNRRLLGRLTASWHHEGFMEMDLTASYTHLDFTRPYPGGYWSPDWVRNGSLTAKVKAQRNRWTMTLEGSVGLEREAGAGATTVGGGSARLGMRVTSNWFIALDGGHSRSSFSTASGYSRTFAGLVFKGVF